MLRTLWVLAAFLACAQVALPGARAGEDDKREKVRQKVREIIKARITEALELDEKTSNKLFPVIDKFHDDNVALQKDNGKTRRELKTLLDADKPDDAKINKAIDRIVANRAKQAELEEDLFKDVRKILTAKQAAKVVVLLPRMRERMEKQIRKAAERRMKKDLDDDDDDF